MSECVTLYCDIIHSFRSTHNLYIIYKYEGYININTRHDEDMCEQV